MSNNQTCNCNNHALCGPGFGVNELSDDATSDKACSTFEAANDCACREPIKKIIFYKNCLILLTTKMKTKYKIIEMTYLLHTGVFVRHFRSI